MNNHNLASAIMNYPQAPYIKPLNSVSTSYIPTKLLTQPTQKQTHARPLLQPQRLIPLGQQENQSSQNFQTKPHPIIPPAKSSISHARASRARLRGFVRTHERRRVACTRREEERTASSSGRTLSSLKTSGLVRVTRKKKQRHAGICVCSDTGDKKAPVGLNCRGSLWLQAGRIWSFEMKVVTILLFAVCCPFCAQRVLWCYCCCCCLV